MKMRHQLSLQLRAFITPLLSEEKLPITSSSLFS